MKETHPLRLPASLKKAVERLSREDGTSMNQFMAVAVAEKVSARETARYFEEKRTTADLRAFDRILKRKGGVPPQAGDEMPQKRQKRKK